MLKLLSLNFNYISFAPTLSAGYSNTCSLYTNLKYLSRSIAGIFVLYYFGVKSMDFLKANYYLA